MSSDSEDPPNKKGGFFKSRFSSFKIKRKQSEKKEEPPEKESIQEPIEPEESIEPKIETEVEQPELAKPVVKSLLERVSESESERSFSFEDFVDEQLLVSRDAIGSKEMKIKILEVSDENPPQQWKLGDRVKVNKILITIKHLDSQEVEEGELDIEAVEKELAEKRHYTSTNRWVPPNDIKNGYVVGGRHISLISDAIALDYITF